MRVLYGKTKAFYVPPCMPKIEANITVSNVCEQKDLPDCIEGYVLCSDCMQPISNAKLVFVSSSFHATIQTDGNGYYKLFVIGDTRQLKCWVYARDFKKAYVDQFFLQNNRRNIVLYKRHGTPCCHYN